MNIFYISSLIVLVFASDYKNETSEALYKVGCKLSGGVGAEILKRPGFMEKLNPLVISLNRARLIFNFAGAFCKQCEVCTSAVNELKGAVSDQQLVENAKKLGVELKKLGDAVKALNVNEVKKLELEAEVNFKDPAKELMEGL